MNVYTSIYVYVYISLSLSLYIYIYKSAMSSQALLSLVGDSPQGGRAHTRV